MHLRHTIFHGLGPIIMTTVYELLPLKSFVAAFELRTFEKILLPLHLIVNNIFHPEYDIYPIIVHI